MNHLLVFDIGGTNIRAAYLEGGIKKTSLKEPHAPFRSFLEWYDASPFKEIKPDRLVIAAAGPHTGTHLKMTNLGWEFDQKELENHFKADVILLNDLEAGVHVLQKATEYFSLQGMPHEEVKALISPGTGLGEAFIVPGKERWHAYPTEGGHTFFAPRNNRQEELFKNIGESPLEIESLLSGRGIQLIHLSLTGEEATPEEILKQDGETVELFVEILLNEAANFALKILPKGGIFLGGGIVRSLAPRLKKTDLSAFYQHPTMEPLLRKIPLLVLETKDLVLEGAILRGQKR